MDGLGGGVKHGLFLVRPLAGLHDITIFHTTFEGFTPDLLREVYGFDLPGVRFETLDHPESLPRITRDFDLFLNIGYGSLAPAKARINVLLVFFPLPLDDAAESLPLSKRLAQNAQRFRSALLELVDRLSPSLQQHSFAKIRSELGWNGALLRLPLFAIRKFAWSGGNKYRLGYPALNDYTKILANSEYTSKWIRRYYRKESEVSYPPIDIGQFTPGKKEPLMLSVGRFEPSRMSKRHDALLEVFKELHAGGVLQGWRLVICGGSDGSPEFISTIQSLRRAAEGLPVSIEVNVPFSRLRDLYAASSIYLHAMGLDQDPDSSPWAFEHFGMTTVEAMAAGAVPFVFSGGGQTEIVTHGENGFLWKSRDELKLNIRGFLNMGDTAKSVLRERARLRSLDFGEPAFYARTCGMYEEMGIRAAAPPVFHQDEQIIYPAAVKPDL